MRIICIFNGNEYKLKKDNFKKHSFSSSRSHKIWFGQLFEQISLRNGFNGSPRLIFPKVFYMTRLLKIVEIYMHINITFHIFVSDNVRAVQLSILLSWLTRGLLLQNNLFDFNKTLQYMFELTNINSELVIIRIEEWDWWFRIKF